MTAHNQIDDSDFDLRFLEGESCVPWQPPVVGGPDSSNAGPLSSASQEAGHQARVDEAIAQGLEEGRATGLAEYQQRLDTLNTMIDALAHPLQDLDEAVEQQLTYLAMAVARQLVFTSLKAQPEQIVDIVRRAIAELPASASRVRVQVNPRDAELLRDIHTAESAWRIVEDPAVARGGCQILSDSTRIDEQLETRLARAIAEVYGDAPYPAELGAPPAESSSDADREGELPE